MPFTYSYTENRFFCLLTGIVTWDDLYSATGILYGSKNLDDIREILVVFSEDAKLVVTDQNTLELAYLDKAAMNYNSKLNFAFVASTPGARSVCLNYIKSSRKIGNTWNYKLYNTMEEAKIWLNYQKEHNKMYN